MSQTTNTIIERQNAIFQDNAEPLPLPKFDTYSVCNLRGGIGKTSLVFNLSFDTDELLTVDTCPQGNLSYFYDSSYYQSSATSANDMLLPYFIPGLGRASRVAKLINATNPNFANKNSYFIPSATELYMMPSQMANALVQAKTMSGANQTLVIDNMLYSLKTEIKREMKETNTKRCLIDTSPFFSGATHLAWHACDALIIPVRTDQQSINSLSLLIDTLSNPASEFRRNMPSDGHTPKIQMVVLTHCGWSTAAGSRNKPNQQTKIFLEKVRDIVNRNITHFTTQNPDNHIMLLDDFLGCGRISSAESKPILLLYPGYSKTINRIKTTVNPSVEKIQGQLRFISSCIW
jgi:cellulose biosynthesis protein BcsQ